MAVLTNLVASGLGSKKSKVTDFIISNGSSKSTKKATAFDSFAGAAMDYKGPKK